MCGDEQKEKIINQIEDIFLIINNRNGGGGDNSGSNKRSRDDTDTHNSNVSR